MRGRPAREVLIGFVVGLLLVAVLIWIPQSRQIDFRWLTDPFVYMGVPIIVICSAVGALVGVLWTKNAESPDAVEPGAALGASARSC